MKNSDWDAVGHKNAYFGSGVGLANGRISFSFGMTTKGKSNVPVSSAQWFAFSTNLNAKSVTPKRQFNSPKEPEKQRLNLIDTKPMSFLFLFRTKKSLMVRKISMI